MSSQIKSAGGVHEHAAGLSTFRLEQRLGANRSR
mgnify:CR=1 FL=1